jgi:hypothetical protein
MFAFIAAKLYDYGAFLAWHGMVVSSSSSSSTAYNR